MVDGRQLSPDGIEVNFATNVVGPYLLTEKLIPKLSKSKSIVLTVTSGGALTTKLEPIDLELKSKDQLKGIDSYAQNKRQQMEMTAHWVEKYSSTGIFFCTAHPGWADTPAVRSSMPEFYEKMKNELRTAEQGADTIVWAVIAERARSDFSNGSFFEDRRAVSEHLPLSGTHSSTKARNLFIENLNSLIESKVEK
jgi:dehydrogenase/reductase SDR family protein 12